MGSIDYTTVRPGASRTKKGTMGLYGQSKLGNVLVARESARRHADKGILVNAVHPGWIGTDLQRHASSVQQWISVRAWKPGEAARKLMRATRSRRSCTPRRLVR
jgi:retinol dehydrogenase-12